MPLAEWLARGPRPFYLSELSPRRSVAKLSSLMLCSVVSSGMYFSLHPGVCFVYLLTVIVAKLHSDSPTSNPPSMPLANERKLGSAAIPALRPLHPRALPAQVGRKLVPIGASLRLVLTPPFRPEIHRLPLSGDCNPGCYPFELPEFGVSHAGSLLRILPYTVDSGYCVVHLGLHLRRNHVGDSHRCRTPRGLSH